MQRIHLVHKHVARRGAHEEFDTWNACRVEMPEEFHVVVGGTKEKAVVDMACPRTSFELVGKRIQCCRLRLTVGHIKEGGHSAKSGSA